MRYVNHFSQLTRLKLVHSLTIVLKFQRLFAGRNLKHTIVYLPTFALVLAPLFITHAKTLILPKPALPSHFIETNEHKSRLGQLLFFDPILSGNNNIACSTCHHPNFATADGVSLSVGEGGQGLGPKRIPVKGKNRPEQRIPRNAPALFNLGAKEFQVMFHDGRLEADSTRSSGIRTPLEDEMMLGFDSVLSAQSMFPVLSPDEMAGHYSENEISKAVRMGIITGPNGAWRKIAERIQKIPEYVALFQRAIPKIKSADDVRFTDISNVIAIFIASEWQAIDSPFDHYLGGDRNAMPESAKAGMGLFYGKAGCSGCHSGTFQTDHSFHSVALPEFGPGKIGRFESIPEDLGRGRVTGKPEDNYRFRTPSLRNVSLTAPYGHNGAFATLQGIIKHHLDPAMSLAQYSFNQLKLQPLEEQDAKDLDIQRYKNRIDSLLKSTELRPQLLTDLEINQLVAFLEALTDVKKGKGKLGIPNRVPSGLRVE